MISIVYTELLIPISFRFWSGARRKEEEGQETVEVCCCCCPFIQIVLFIFVMYIPTLWLRSFDLLQIAVHDVPHPRVARRLIMCLITGSAITLLLRSTSFSMDENDLMITEVGNDQLADIKPEIRDDFYYCQSLVFKVCFFIWSNSIIQNWDRKSVV